MNYPIDITGITLKTNRLVLRPFALSDLDDFNEYASVPGVGERAGWPHHTSKEESLRILNHFLEGKHTFAITLNNKVIGSLGVEEYNDKFLPEFDELKVRMIGYVLSKDYWNQGIMSEAVNAVLDYLFNVVGLDVVLCAHFEENIPSYRVQQKCGFTHYKFSDSFSTNWGEKKNGWISIRYKK